MARVTLRQLVAKYFPPEQIDNILALIDAESGGYPGAWNSTGEDSRGLLQVNLAAHRQWANVDLTNPDTNLRLASQLWQSGGWNPWFNNANKLGLRQGKKASPNQSIGNNVVDTEKSYVLRRTGQYPADYAKGETNVSQIGTPGNIAVNERQPMTNDWQSFITWATDNDYIDLDPEYYKDTGVSYNAIVDYLWSNYGDQFTRETGREKPSTSFANRWQPGQMPGGGRSLMGPPGEETAPVADWMQEIQKVLPDIAKRAATVAGNALGVSGPITNAANLGRLAGDVAGAAISAIPKKPPTPGEVITQGQYATEWEVSEGPIAASARATNAPQVKPKLLTAETVGSASVAEQSALLDTIFSSMLTPSVGYYSAQQRVYRINQLRILMAQAQSSPGSSLDVAFRKRNIDPGLFTSELGGSKSIFETAVEEFSKQAATDLEKYEAIEGGVVQPMTAAQAAAALNAEARQRLDEEKFKYDKEQDEYKKYNMSPREAALSKAEAGRLEFDVEREKWGRENLSAAEKAVQEANKAVNEVRQAELEQKRVEERQRIKEAMDTSRMRALELITNARQKATQMYGDQARYALAPGQQWALGFEPGGLANRVGIPSVGLANTIPFNAFEGVGQAQSELEKILAEIAGRGG